MKTRLRIFCLLLLSGWITLPLSATIITVDNGANSGGQYTMLQTAIDNASTGDTLHVIGSNTSYGSATLNKSLTLIGAGYNPPNQFGLKSQIATLTLGQVSPGISADGSKITGFLISNITWAFSAVLNNITIERCEVPNGISLAVGNSSGWVLQHNILWNVALNNNPNCMIRNNIIEGLITTSDEPSVVITHNVFTYFNNNGSSFSNVSHATISNNIFYRSRSPRGAQLSAFNNNITFLTSNDTLPYGNNTGSNNLMATDPQIANAPSGGYEYAYDYRLNTGSPALGAGTGSSDIGTYGGLTPMPLGGPAPYLTSAPPPVPQVIEFDILTPNLTPGSVLQFHVKARKQN